MKQLTDASIAVRGAERSASSASSRHTGSIVPRMQTYNLDTSWAEMTD
jgi:hypothetical protein